MARVLEGFDHGPEGAARLEVFAEIEHQDDDRRELERLPRRRRGQDGPDEAPRGQAEEDGHERGVEEEHQAEVPLETDEDEQERQDESDLEEDDHVRRACPPRPRPGRGRSS
jgi:hypothetical protein